MKLVVTMEDPFVKAAEERGEYRQERYTCRYRSRTIELTPEQSAAIAPWLLGEKDGKPVYEDIVSVELETSEFAPGQVLSRK